MKKHKPLTILQLRKGFSITGGSVFAYKALPEFDLEPNNGFRMNIIELSY
ncbi:MAG TPA: hypothetical protein PKC30_04125 [Saprospiraceae bacterium]|nr:hypothetical protein [Saprospiraceae bacterium]